MLTTESLIGPCIKVDVCLVLMDEDGFERACTIKMSKEEAFALLQMPGFNGLINCMIPHYELPEMSQKES